MMETLAQLFKDAGYVRALGKISLIIKVDELSDFLMKYWMIGSQKGNSMTGEYNGLIQAFDSFLLCMKRHLVNLVFVISGTPEAIRDHQRLQKIQHTIRFLCQVDEKTTKLHVSCLPLLTDAIKKRKLNFYVADGDPNQAVAHLACSLQAYIFAQDADFLLYDSPGYFLSSSIVVPLKNSRYPAYARCLKAQFIAQKLHLTPTFFPALATLCDAQLESTHSDVLEIAQNIQAVANKRMYDWDWKNINSFDTRYHVNWKILADILSNSHADVKNLCQQLLSKKISQCPFLDRKADRLCMFQQSPLNKNLSFWQNYSVDVNILYRYRNLELDFNWSLLFFHQHTIQRPSNWPTYALTYYPWMLDDLLPLHQKLYQLYFYNSKKKIQDPINILRETFTLDQKNQIIVQRQAVLVDWKLFNREGRLRSYRDFGKMSENERKVEFLTLLDIKLVKPIPRYVLVMATLLYLQRRPNHKLCWTWTQLLDAAWATCFTMMEKENKLKEGLKWNLDEELVTALVFADLFLRTYAVISEIHDLCQSPWPRRISNSELWNFELFFSFLCHKIQPNIPQTQKMKAFLKNPDTLQENIVPFFKKSIILPITFEFNYFKA